MAKKKATAKVEPNVDQISGLSNLELMIAKAKERLSSRKVFCEKCFAPRNSLTVPKNVGQIWTKSEIEIIDKTVYVPCPECKNKRELSLSSVGLNFLEQDLKFKYTHFVLLKDGDYNALIGSEQKDLLAFAQEVTENGQ